MIAAGRQELSGATQLQDITLAGADWNPKLIASSPGNTRAFIIDNIVAVYEKNLSLEFEN